MALGTFHLTLKLNCVLVVRRILIIVLTANNFGTEKALLVLNEIQEKIYEDFPKIKNEKEDEKLSGARLYISNVCFKYNASDSIEEIEQPMNLKEYRESIKNTNAINIDLTNTISEVVLIYII